MPGQPYTPSGTYPTFPISLPKDGEQWSFDSIMQSSDPTKGPLSKAFDAADYVKQRLDGIAGVGGGVSIGRVISPSDYVLLGTNWTIQTTGNVDANSTSAQGMNIDLNAENLPHGATLVTVGVSFLAATGHAGLPTVMPTVSICSFDPIAGLATLVTVTDNSALWVSNNVTGYQTQHLIPAQAPANTVVDRTAKRYFAQFSSEGGTNAVAGGLVVGVTVIYKLA